MHTKVCTTHSRLVDPASVVHVMQLQGSCQSKARAVLFIVVPPLQSRAASISISSKTKAIESEAHEHEGGGMARRSSPALRKETPIYPSHRPRHAAKTNIKTKGYWNLEPKDATQDALKKSGRCSPGYLCKSGTPSWCEHGESRVNRAETWSKHQTISRARNSTTKNF